MNVETGHRDSPTLPFLVRTRISDAYFVPAMVGTVISLRRAFDASP
jgi:hypothetical protein